MNAYEGMECPDCKPGRLELIGVAPDIDVFPARDYWVTYDLYRCDFCGRWVHDTEHPVAYIDGEYVPLETVDPDWYGKRATRRAIAMRLQPMLPGVAS